MPCIMKMEWPERRLQSSMNGSLDRATPGLEAWQHCSPKEKLDRIVNWFTLPPMHKTKTASSLTRQAAYQRRRRARQRPATFFPADRDRMDRAVRESGLGLQGWLARAVEERIAHQARLARLVSDAFRRFRAKCFWNVSEDQPLSLLAPLVVKRLRKYGGMAGLRLAAEIEALAPEETRWP